MNVWLCKSSTPIARSKIVKLTIFSNFSRIRNEKVIELYAQLKHPNSILKEALRFLI